MAWQKKKDWNDNFKKEDPLLVKIQEEPLVKEIICNIDDENSSTESEKEPELIINDSHFEIDSENDSSSNGGSLISEEIRNEQMNNRLKQKINDIIDEHTNYLPFLRKLNAGMVMEIFTNG